MHNNPRTIIRQLFTITWATTDIDGGTSQRLLIINISFNSLLQGWRSNPYIDVDVRFEFEQWISWRYTTSLCGLGRLIWWMSVVWNKGMNKEDELGQCRLKLLCRNLLLWQSYTAQFRGRYAMMIIHTGFDNWCSARSNATFRPHTFLTPRRKPGGNR